MKRPKTKKEGERLLLEAALRNHHNIILQLLAHGIDPNTAASSSLTPHRALPNAAKVGATASVIALLSSPKAKFDIADESGRNALHWCCKRGHAETFEAILAHFDQHPPFREIMTPLGKLRKTFPKIRDILEIQDKQGRTCLTLASWSGHAKIVQRLLQLGAVGALNANERSRGWTPLHGACLYGHTNVVGLLLQHGAHPDAEDLRQSAPIHLASRNGYTNTVRALLQSGAMWDTTNVNGYTALHEASLNGHHETVEVIVQFVKSRGELAKLYKVIPAFDKLYGRSVLGLAQMRDTQNRDKTVANIKATTALIFSDYCWHKLPAC